jgi:uncharacterized protein
MESRIFEIESPNGTLRGNIRELPGAPLVVLLCGHNGFYHFAFFPTLQQHLIENGYSSVAFNYSHCGISDHGDYFDDLSRYEKNCRRLEVEDTVFLVSSIDKILQQKPSHLFLLGHSMGGFNTGFVADKLVSSGINVNGLVFLNALKTLDIRTKEIMDEWQANGVYHRNNGRTHQDLPQGKEFLEETLASHDKWNLEKTIGHLVMPILVVHGSADEAVPFEHGLNIFSWIDDNNDHNEFIAIENGTHTLNTSHVGNRESEQLDEFCGELVEWLDGVA